MMTLFFSLRDCQVQPRRKNVGGPSRSSGLRDSVPSSGERGQLSARPWVTPDIGVQHEASWTAVAGLPVFGRFGMTRMESFCIVPAGRSSGSGSGCLGAAVAAVRTHLPPRDSPNIWAMDAIPPQPI